jgi:hypothetical protein
VKRYLLAAVVAALTGSLLFGGIASGSKRARPVHYPNALKQAAQGKLRAASIPIRVRRNGRTRIVQRKLPFFSAGTLAAVYGSIRGDELRKEAAGTDAQIQNPGHGNPGHGTLGCSTRDSHGNVRVNQDCSYRRQAEVDITYNPRDPNNLTAGQNDSRVGFNQCGIDWSTDNGSHWGDMLPPFRQRLNAPEFMGPSADNPNNNTILGTPGTFHTYDAASDPANAVDAFGRAYFSCVVFDVATFASGLFVTQSPAPAQGSFYYNVPSPPSKLFMVVEDNDIEVFHDKNMITADRYRSSPNAGNVYVTWTVFKFSPNCGHPPDGSEQFCASPIFGSMSTDGGQTWSTPEEISGNAPGLCFFGDFFNGGAPNDCNFDQGSSPVALPNGDLEVIFNNGNTAPGNPNAQQLGVHCHPSGSSTAGTAHFNCVTPAKVGDDFVIGEPQCDFGRGPEECIPGAYIRTNDFPRITKDNTQNNHVYAVWQDYRNGEYDTQLSASTDGGLTWNEAGTVNPDRGLDHYFPATDQSPQNGGGHWHKGDRNGASYYRTGRVPGENDPTVGCLLGISPPDCTPFTPGVQPGVGEQDSDYVLAGGRGDNTPYDFRVVSPVFPPPDGIQSGFNGDYSGLTVNHGEDAHPIWSDTRNVNPFPLNGVVRDEDVFTDKVGLPDGHSHHSHGVIGKSSTRRASRK